MPPEDQARQNFNESAAKVEAQRGAQAAADAKVALEVQHTRADAYRRELNDRQLNLRQLTDADGSFAASENRRFSHIPRPESAMLAGDGLSFDRNGPSFSDLAVGGAPGSGRSSSLSGWQRSQAHALGLYDAGSDAVESASYSFGLGGTEKSRAAWAVKVSTATIEAIRNFDANRVGPAVSEWWNNLTSDDPAAIRQATAQGTGVALGMTSGVVLGRLSSGGIASTGARSLSLAEFERQLVAADRAYGEIRLSTTDIQSVAQNIGVHEFQAARVKNHLFLDSHQLSARVGPFDADLDIANAWRRMDGGTHTPDDIKLFKHEYFESKFEKIFRTNYEDAHNAAQKRYPSPLIDY
jgi:hypothetical protein